ncbi:MAG TPA: UDP-N-acetylmuramoyl-tripeptide--D-alanyl-D-alanine ligase [Bacteroidia bacterium]|jgi:UDP-N-acetylmuramoyl-tripeptide--D-alanyl-D-alanine ligase
MLQRVEDIYEIYLQHPFICTDTRRITKGSVFFALRGGNFNGNEFAEKALKGGCAYAVVDEKEYVKDERYLLVEDALLMLQLVAKHHRSLLTIPVLGITGSNGKTTTKELIRAVLAKKYRALATEGNLNNHIGVPLTILSITDEIEIAVVEMGANHQGEIASLCAIAQPSFGIITNIGKAHLEGFGGPQGVIKAKGELYQYLRQNSGRAFVNADNTLLVNLAGAMEVTTYGTGNMCQVSGRIVSSEDHLTFAWKSKKDEVPLDQKEAVHSHLVGKYNFENILAAICIGNYFNVAAGDINKAIEEYVPSNNRSQVLKKGSNTLVLDAYNANPSSMSAAIGNFSELKAEKKILILGDMLELGAHAEEEHRNILDLVRKNDFSQVILVGPLFSKEAKKEFKSFATAEEAAKFLKKLNLKNSSILIKGSRGIKLETVVDAL